MSFSVVLAVCPDASVCLHLHFRTGILLKIYCRAVILKHMLCQRCISSEPEMRMYWICLCSEFDTIDVWFHMHVKINRSDVPNRLCAVYESSVLSMNLVYFAQLIE